MIKNHLICFEVAVNVNILENIDIAQPLLRHKLVKNTKVLVQNTSD